jgi:hypothetical protein
MHHRLAGLTRTVKISTLLDLGNPPYLPNPEATYSIDTGPFVTGRR